MDLKLTQQHVLITGGSKGIGLACAHGFLRKGAKISLVSRSPANLKNAVEQLLTDFPGAEGPDRDLRCRSPGCGAGGTGAREG